MLYTKMYFQVCSTYWHPNIIFLFHPADMLYL